MSLPSRLASMSDLLVHGGYVGAYWGPRKEDAEACAARLQRCLDGLASTSELLASWYLRGMSSAAREPVGREHEALVTLISTGRHRADGSKKLMDDLGFTIGAWNGNKELPAAWDTLCGGYADVAGIMNSFVLDLPARDQDMPSTLLYDPQASRAILRTIIDAWDPDWAVFTSHTLRNLRDRPPRAPHVGWLTYLSSPRAVPPDAAKIASVETQDTGTILALGDSSVELRERTVAELLDLLTKEGSLEPTPTTSPTWRP